MGANRQPFYHRAVVLFVATDDVSDSMKTPEFRLALARFLKRNLGPVLLEHVDVEGVDAEPGDPADLM